MKIENLYEQYKSENHHNKASMIIFLGCEGYDVYNITAPFEFEGKQIIAGRVEKRTSEDSKIILFNKLSENLYRKVESQFELKLQDPFVTSINNRMILGGVETIKENGNIISWRTNFYYLNSFSDVQLIFKGPLGMKDIRLKQLNDEKILMLTRPQGEKGGRGKIGYALVDDINDITLRLIEEAPLLQNNFQDEEWGGANEIYILEDGEIVVLGHIANFDSIDGSRNYYPIVFKLDLANKRMTNVEIIAERKEFIGDESKNENLYNVIFSGGLIFKSKETVVLYAGVGDVTGQKIKLRNPFSQIAIQK